MSYRVHKGFPAPLGCSRREGGINFALFSEHATAVTLVLFTPGEESPFLAIPLDPNLHKTGHIWHACVCHLPSHVDYGYRIDGPRVRKPSHHFDPSVLLSDPYAKALSTSHVWGEKHRSIRGRVVLESLFEWNDDRFPRIPMKDLILYEMHVRGFTCHPSSRTKHPGTFLGVIEKIPYLKELGINAVELLPVHEFNESELLIKNPKTGQLLKNFWGYSTINFFTPMKRYATSSEWGASIEEFKQMVKALHKAGIEVILDVVYNHTAEGDLKGPTLSYSGIDNSTYYILGPNGDYLNFSGCGNTFNCNHPVVSQLILDSLRYWVGEMHVDGFRFDLASILTRSETGEPLSDPPLIRAINSDPLLAETKLIAEAWDAACLYQVGAFPGGARWAEWNGKYRDVVRNFIKGTDNCAGAFSRALAGSQDLYGHGREPYHSVNFVTCHDGFSLKDLVSYQEKHNLENGEENRDGTNDNASWNCGEEGETKNDKVLDLRKKQMRNYHAALLLSIGTPMLLMGDEYGHTHHGNNNAWCQDTATNWFLWEELEKDPAFFRFYRLLIQFRKTHPILRRDKFLTDADVQWHGLLPLQANWGSESRFLAYTLKDQEHGNDLYIAFNAQHTPATVTLPPLPADKQWFRVMDTALSSPHDFEEQPEKLLEPTYTMQPHTTLLAKML